MTYCWPVNLFKISLSEQQQTNKSKWMMRVAVVSARPSPRVESVIGVGSYDIISRLSQIKVRKAHRSPWDDRFPLWTLLTKAKHINDMTLHVFDSARQSKAATPQDSKCAYHGRHCQLPSKSWSRSKGGSGEFKAQDETLKTRPLRDPLANSNVSAFFRQRSGSLQMISISLTFNHKGTVSLVSSMRSI